MTHLHQPILLLLLCLFLSACSPTDQTTTSKPIPVTDETIRAQLWEDYLCDAIGTIGNKDFAVPEEAENLGPFLYYTVSRMAANGQLTVANNQLTLPPLSIMQEQLKRYFNTDFGLTEESYASLYTYHSGEPEQGTLYFRPDMVSYADSAAWTYRLGEVTFDEAAQTYQAAVEHIANPDTGRVDLIRAFTLKQRDNGELYFVSHQWQYPPLPEGLVELAGGFTELPGLKDYFSEPPVQPYSIQSAGAWNDQLLFVLHTFVDQSHTWKIYLFTYSPKEDRVLAEYAFTETAEHLYSGLRLQGDRLLLRFTDGYTYLDSALQPTGELQPLPEAVRSAVNLDYEWAGCYDISDDERTFYYLRDKKALWQYDTVTQTEKPLFRRANLDFPGNYGLFDLQLLPTQQTLIMTLAGYDGPIGQYALSLDAPTEGRQYRTHHEPLQNWSNDGCPLPDVDYSTLLEGGAYLWSLLPVADAPAAESFAVSVTEEQQFSEVYRGDSLLYNDRYAVYSNRFTSGGYPENSTYHLIRVDLQAHIAQTLISSQAAELQPVAVLSDGRVLFSYDFEQLHGWGLTE